MIIDLINNIMQTSKSTYVHEGVGMDCIAH